MRFCFQTSVGNIVVDIPLWLVTMAFVAAKVRCEQCRKAFVPKRPWQRFDRTECQRKAAQERLLDRLRAEVMADIRAQAGVNR